MKPEIAKAALQFMNRVRLEGVEVPAFNAVVAELQVEANPAPPDASPAQPIEDV